MIFIPTDSAADGRAAAATKKWVPDVLQTSRDVHGTLWSSADPAVTTRRSVILTLRAKTAMQNLHILDKIVSMERPGAF